MPRHQESSIQQACVAHFRNIMHPELKGLLFAVRGGARNAFEAGIMKGEGVWSGVSDCILLVPSKGYHGLCIEFKRKWFEADKKGRIVEKRSYQEKEQKEWQALVEAQGYRYAVVRSLDEFKELINSYLEQVN